MIITLWMSSRLGMWNSLKLRVCDGGKNKSRASGGVNMGNRRKVVKINQLADITFIFHQNWQKIGKSERPLSSVVAGREMKTQSWFSPWAG
jgi:hypothetical protein